MAWGLPSREERRGEAMEGRREGLFLLK